MQGVTQAQIDGALAAVPVQVRLEAMNALMQQHRLQVWKDQAGRNMFKHVSADHAIKCARPAYLAAPYTAWHASCCSVVNPTARIEHAKTVRTPLPETYRVVCHADSRICGQKSF